MERIERRAAEAAKGAKGAKAASPWRGRTRASRELELNSEQASALEDSKRKRDAAMDRLDDLSSTSKPDQEESPAIENSRRESSAQRAPRLTDVSGLDLDDDMFGNLDDSLEDTEHAIDDDQNGYRSTDTSTFNIAMFRRRPRQSSIAGRDDAPIRPSSRGHNTPSISTTINFGNFKRRAREPSILGTGRKPLTQRSQSQASRASPNESILADGDDSGPDGESTPLDRTRRRTRASLAANSSGEGTPASPTRKRKSLESHADGREKRIALGSDEAEEIRPSIEVDPEAGSKTPPRGRTRERERFSTPVRRKDDDPDMAPPLSSSSSEGDSPPVFPPLETLAHRTYARRPAPRTQTPELGDADSQISSPPSLTHSPNYAPANTRHPAKRKAPAPQKITTAELTSLLPRRRHKVRSRDDENSNDPFDMESSDDDDGDDDRRGNSAAGGQNEDDVSYVDSWAARRKRAASHPLSRSASNRKGKAADAGNAGNNKRRNLRTYGSASENKENEEVQEEIAVGSAGDAARAEDDLEGGPPEEETSQMMRERIGEELQKAAAKFKEVDKWELSFEEVAGSSSPDPYAR